MRVKKFSAMLIATLLSAAFLAPVADAAIIAGWNQNSNALPAGGFGFTPASFPQVNDHGPATASHTIADFDGTDTTAPPKYDFVESFGGTTTNDLSGAGAGGSFSFEGSQNNGAKSVFSVPTTGFEDIKISWAQRGTSSGYTSRVFEYSTNAGGSWTDVGAYAGSAGVLSSTFTTVSIDLSAVSAVDNNANVMFRITYDGATSTTGNNRWDNFYVEGTEVPLVPEPSSLALVALSLGAILIRRK